MRVEVKHLNHDFTCHSDWPFGEKFIVCACHTWDSSKPKPFIFIYLNKAMTHVAVVLGSSHARWYIEENEPGQYDGVKHKCYYASMDDVEFFRLPTKARRRAIEARARRADR